MKKYAALCLINALMSASVFAQAQNVEQLKKEVPPYKNFVQTSTLTNQNDFNVEVFNNSETYGMEVEYSYAPDNSYYCTEKGRILIPNAKEENHSVNIKRLCRIIKVTSKDANANDKLTVNYSESGSGCQAGAEWQGVPGYSWLSNAIMLDDMHNSRNIACIPILVQKS